MYVEFDREFQNFYQTRLSYLEANAGLAATLRYAWDHPDDRWGGPVLSRFPAASERLLEQASYYPENVAVRVGSVLLTGEVEGDRIDLPYANRRAGGWNQDWPEHGDWRGVAEAVCDRRLKLARLCMNVPDVATFMIEQKVFAFHGTGGVALPSLLRHGLLSHREMHERGMVLMTGEMLLPTGRDRATRFIEWDLLSTALCYAKAAKITVEKMEQFVSEWSGCEYGWFRRKAEEYKIALEHIRGGGLDDFEVAALEDPFEVLVGLSANIFEKRIDTPVDSDIEAEIGFLGWGVSGNYLPVLFVPERKVEAVKGLANNIPVRVEDISALRFIR